MSQEFYSLEEAAKKLGLTTQELNSMAQHREIRAFADRGTWRFRVGDIEDLASRRGLVSNPQFRLSDPDIDQPGADVKGTPSAEKKGPGSERGDTGKIDLAAIAGDEDDSPQSSSFVFGNKPVAGMTDTSGPPSPVNPDDESVVPLGREPIGLQQGDSRVRLDSPSGRLPDMGVHLVDFNMKPISDPPSSRKLVPPPIPQGGSGKITPASGKIPKADSGQITPVKKKGDTGRIPPAPGQQIHASSEFDLKPTQQGPTDSIFDFTAPSMPEINLDLSGQGQGKDVVDLGGTPVTPAQGGSMRAKLPAMEEESSTFELNLEPSSEEMLAMPRTPRPDGGPKDTSSEFDLSLQVPQDSSSDFELSVEDSSSGTISALDASPSDESGPKTAKIQSEDVQVGEDSDFELALDDDAPVVDETGSEVVVIDEEQSPTDLMGASAAAGAARRRRAAEAPAEEEAVVEPYEEEEEEDVYVSAPGRTAEWGWWSMLHVPTVLVMIFTGFMLFEMVRSISGYETKSRFTGKIFEMVKSITD